MTSAAIKKRVNKIVASFPKDPAIAPRKPSTATTLSIIANHLGRIADAMEKRNQPPCDGILKAYTAAKEAYLECVSPADYIRDVYGETKENAERIVANCQKQDDDDGETRQ